MLALSSSIPSSSSVDGRSTDGRRPPCALGRRLGGGGGPGLCEISEFTGLNASSDSLVNEYRDDPLLTIPGLVTAFLLLFFRANGGGGGVFLAADWVIPSSGSSRGVASPEVKG